MPSSSFTGSLPLCVRSRVLVTHPVNPPMAVPVVELVPSPDTHADVIEATRCALRSVGMSPITLRREVPGFVVNRLQYALLGEAFRLVMDGVASPEDVDTAITDGLGARWAFMGPFQTIDLNAPEGVRDYCDRYATPLLEVMRTQDNTRDWTPEVRAELEAWARQRTPVERIGAACAWRDERLMRLAVERKNAPAFPPLAYSVEEYPLAPPDTSAVVGVLRAALSQLFERVTVEMAPCPDLTAAPWHLQRRGLGGRPVLVDAGGAWNVEHVAGHERTLNTVSVAAAVGRSRAWAIGPAAACRHVVGVNAELVVDDDTACTRAHSHSSKIDASAWKQEEYHSHALGPLANLLVCDGEPATQVLHVRCEKWKGGNPSNRSFVAVLREALADAVEKPIAAGGVVRIEGEGAKIRAHVMPDWCDTDLTTSEQVNDWLRFFEMDAPVTATSTFVTHDMGASLRPDHTHFFSEHGACGHYHYDTTPQAVVYDAYYGFAESVFRVERPADA
eukprot:TRINITY_DN15971_c0_g1_i1.p1 TRINITY_DN15971_c0_g1~~TRINITY_DN15971_c0_g1_i1.p1  ORF type:complete len:544 (-),score=155.31 TRINITY_DN15971_c0_g1_i1:82-1593(-)